MKTVKQIADDLGVSKQKVYRFIVRNHITASSELKQSKLYDEVAENLIKQGIFENKSHQKSHHEAHQNHINNTVSEAVIELLRRELDQKNEQLKEKDRQISERNQQITALQEENRELSRKLLELSGKISDSLQMIAKTQLADKMVEGRKIESQEDSSLVGTEDPEENKGFLSRLFRK